MEELKPCPFCGGEARAYLGSYAVGWVQCLECRVITQTYNTKGEAIEMWNTRVKSKEQYEIKEIF
jgi:Lar family restriction alleviation protein